MIVLIREMVLAPVGTVPLGRTESIGFKAYMLIRFWVTIRKTKIRCVRHNMAPLPSGIYRLSRPSMLEDSRTPIKPERLVSRWRQHVVGLE